MRTEEWFSGFASFSAFMAKQGHSTFTIDNDASFSPDLCADMMTYEPKQPIWFAWASIPCTTFSVASIGHHWTGGHRAYIPKTPEAETGLRLLDHTIYLIAKFKPTYWCIENPRGVMRKVIDRIFAKYGIVDYHRITICYCQYGDTRMKPTDIWTNIPDWKGRMCHNGSPDHVRARRGAKTGTQGLKRARDRSVIPEGVFREMLGSLRAVNGLGISPSPIVFSHLPAPEGVPPTSAGRGRLDDVR